MKILLYKPDSKDGAFKFYSKVKNYSVDPDNKITIEGEQETVSYEMSRILSASWSDDTKFGPREYVVKVEVRGKAYVRYQNRRMGIRETLYN